MSDKDEHYQKRPSENVKEVIKFLQENPDNITKLTLLEVVNLIDKGKFGIDIKLDLDDNVIYFNMKQKKTNKETLR